MSISASTKRRSVCALLISLVALASIVAVVAASINAGVVLGQPDLTSSGFAATPTQNGLALPYGVAIDRSSGHLYIADTANNRVLGWSNLSALSNGAPADLVLGQVNFTADLSSSPAGDVPVSASGLSSPWSVAVDSKGNLYVSDNDNNRVLEYNSPYNAFGHICSVATPCEGGLAANLVLGQGAAGTSFTTSVDCTVKNDATCMDEPSGIAVDSNDNLYVTDTLNDRLLVFLNPLAQGTGCASSGCASDVVADFALGECAGNNGFLDSQADCSHPAVGMLGPNAVAIDKAGDVFVADTQNNRVLEFNDPVGTSNLAADRVYGNGPSGNDFTPAVCSNGRGADPSPSAGSMCNPAGLVFDATDNLYVSDYSNSRVLEFENPLTNFTANLVIGQDSAGSDFTVGICYGGQPRSGSGTSASATGLCNPAGLAMDSTNNLFVADANNSRMIEFLDPSAQSGGSPTATATAMPTATFSPTPTTSAVATPSATVTPTATPAVTATATTVASATGTPTATATPNPTSTATSTATATATPTPTAISTPTPVEEKLTVSPKNLNFGKVALNKSKTLKVTVKNAGTKKKGLTVLVGPEASTNPAFSLLDDCIGTLAPGRSCQIKVTFSPGAVTAPQSATLSIGADVITVPAPVTMKGSGKAARK